MKKFSLISIWKQMNLQDSNSLVMDNLINFHDHAMMVILMIIVLIFYFLIFMMTNLFCNRFMYEGQLIEIIWTLVPMVFLLFLAVPSLKILYMTDELNNPYLTIKVLGHQWYWSYEYSDFKELNFDSFMVSDYKLSNFRLLDVDNRMVVPMNLNMRVIVSSLDVIHSFTVLSLGVKVDAIPGRLNQLSMNVNRPGLFYGQCSEICGVNHSFMPIVLESNSIKNFLDWINSM